MTEEKLAVLSIAMSYNPESKYVDVVKLGNNFSIEMKFGKLNILQPAYTLGPVLTQGLSGIAPENLNQREQQRIPLLVSISEISFRLVCHSPPMSFDNPLSVRMIVNGLPSERLGQTIHTWKFDFEPGVGYSAVEFEREPC